VEPPKGKTKGYKLSPLPKPSIDTGGAGTVGGGVQGRFSNFETICLRRDAALQTDGTEGNE